MSVNKLRRSKVALCVVHFILLTSTVANAQMTMPGMSAMENSVGFISSGTSVEPRSTSESAPMIHSMWGTWTLLLHGSAFLVDTQQTGPRGRDKLFSVNWLMPMVSHDWGRQSLTFKTMVSLEPATVTERRYPELFQTGETAFGLPIVDAQHPHNFFMEVAARYDFRAGEQTRLSVYGGPIGEPALGPPAYSHRASASENPIAPLGHHEQDSTHISYGVVTLGFSAGPVQLEASTFHGQEPGENRWQFTSATPDSFASRATAAISKDIVGQFSIGRIENREQLEPGLNTLRMTASLLHNKVFSGGHISSSFIWGRNKDLPPGQASRIFNAYLAESTINFKTQHWVWTRIENVDRDQTLLIGEVPAVLQVPETPFARVQAYTFGYERDLPVTSRWLTIGLGTQATVYGVPPQLQTVYGNHPVGVNMFLHVRPKSNLSTHMRMMHGG